MAADGALVLQKRSIIRRGLLTDTLDYDLANLADINANLFRTSLAVQVQVVAGIRLAQ